MREELFEMREELFEMREELFEMREELLVRREEDNFFTLEVRIKCGIRLMVKKEIYHEAFYAISRFDCLAKIPSTNATDLCL